jgi:hypothetical protein
MAAYTHEGFQMTQVEAIDDIMFRGYTSKLRISEREVGASVVVLSSGSAELRFNLNAIDGTNTSEDGTGTVYKYSGADGEGSLDIIWDEPVKTAIDRFNEIMTQAVAQANRK